MSTGVHKVGTLKVNCRVITGNVDPCQAQSVAAQWSEKVLDEVRRTILDVLNDCFARYGQRHISIDRLELNLGRLKLSELPDKARALIEDNLPKQVALSSHDGDGSDWFWAVLRDYLLSGVSPWNAGHMSPHDWSEGLNRIFKDPKTSRKLRKLLSRNQTGLNRLAALKSGLGLDYPEFPVEQLETDNEQAVNLADRDSESIDKNLADLDQAETKIFVGNAGLVLIAPFLPHFFKRLELLDDGGYLKSIRQTTLAVAISQRLLFPEDEITFEGDLSLNKLLCGWPLAQPLPVEPLENVFEKNYLLLEIKSLLKAVLKQWNSLSGGTPGGLIQHFLRRNGILVLDDYPRLEVEKMPHDVLLDTLPWVLSIIQTPWMERPMQVIWND